MDSNKTFKCIGISRIRIPTDGAGITTLVCGYGCPLSCKYCLNPQSLRNDTPTRLYSPTDLYKELLIDDLYFVASDGGVCFGGGEPLLQYEFITEFAKLINGRWKIYIESSLNVPKENVKALIGAVDGWIVDIKDTDPLIYKSYTGCGNEKVMENLKFLISSGRSDIIKARIPLIPEYNTEENCDKSEKLLREMGINDIDRFTYKTNICK
ncbi:MAG: radical SAM protein [Ruminococcaceae bacterium]|nr:radical SAM protein [Oscillospiraceae bacterium]